MSFDISHTLQAKSDQINAVDLVGGPQLITITQVRDGGSKEQPVAIDTKETPGRAFKPAKTVRRILAELWGTDANTWVGRQLVIFNDPSVTWAGEAVGGIRVSHMSHIDGERTVTVRMSRAKRQQVTIKPLENPPARDWLAEAETHAGDINRLRELWAEANTAGASQHILDTIAHKAQEK
ncbi:hypothetical protein QDX21_07175 [Auritidibacter ignavus]|uniref:Uncharacterized protein n=1 Tax=Auritidibacter ignavus TaxID=678932 RepID=A0AAJ6AHI4_9MICC|nr:hypothetical protein [Auritidibacter ignavus]WGH92117.1 hypothetical protein QDX21_07175 [Auritidibacter ignavus]